MLGKLTDWAVNSPWIVILVTSVLAGTGAYAFAKINVEAYPDPAPAIIEVIAQWPGASAEEMDRTIIERWNARVGPADTLYCLGDWCLWRGSKSIGEVAARHIHAAAGDRDSPHSGASHRMAPDN